MEGWDEERRDATVFLGVDTHSEAHVAVALDGAGGRLGELVVPNDRAGYARLWDWAMSLGILVAAGVEGTGSYGAGLSRFLRARGASVQEVNRTSRQHRRRHGKHDAGDAEAAARQVLSGTAAGEPKGADGAAESLRALRVARRSAVKAKTQAANQLHALLSTAPDELREGLRGLPTKHLAAKASRFRCGAGPVDPARATKLAMRSVVRRHQALSEEIAELDAHIEALVEEAAPELVALEGVGPDTAAALLIAAGDNPERLKSEASFAHLCGTAPVPASSGKVVRHRLNPAGGNRDANRALHVVALNRLRRDPRTQEYLARRTAEGKSKKEALRCLKRYIARETYRAVLLDAGARRPPG